MRTRASATDTVRPGDSSAQPGYAAQFAQHPHEDRAADRTTGVGLPGDDSGKRWSGRGTNLVPLPRSSDRSMAVAGPAAGDDALPRHSAPDVQFS